MVYLILVTQDMCQSTVTKNGRPKTLSLPMSPSFPPALRAQRETHLLLSYVFYSVMVHHHQSSHFF